MTESRFTRARAVAEAFPCPSELKRLVLATLDISEPHDRWSREEKRRVYDEYDAAVKDLADIEP